MFMQSGWYLHGETHDEGPEASHLVGLDCLPQGLIMFSVFTLEGIGHQVLVDKDLGVESVFLFQLLDFDIVTLWLDPSRRHLVVCVDGRCASMICMCVSRLGIF
jgi:hypothetical protein